MHDLTLEAPIPTEEELADGVAFEEVMQAFARPGVVRRMDRDAERAIAQALIDLECRAYASRAEMQALLEDLGAEQLGAETAEFAFLDLNDAGDLAIFERLPVGVPLYPDRGATVIARARFNQGAKLRISGPGVAGAAEIKLEGVEAQFWARRAARMAYPLGLDLIFVDGEALMALPRSTQVEAA